MRCVAARHPVLDGGDDAHYYALQVWWAQGLIGQSHAGRELQAPCYIVEWVL